MWVALHGDDFRCLGEDVIHVSFRTAYSKEVAYASRDDVKFLIEISAGCFWIAWASCVRGLHFCSPKLTTKSCLVGSFEVIVAAGALNRSAEDQQEG